jgi:hypothetical protein
MLGPYSEEKEPGRLDRKQVLLIALTSWLIAQILKCPGLPSTHRWDWSVLDAVVCRFTRLVVSATSVLDCSIFDCYIRLRCGCHDDRNL